jgi:hypothetical protein
VGLKILLALVVQLILENAFLTEALQGLVDLLGG